jgi:hypothetical protein
LGIQTPKQKELVTEATTALTLNQKLEGTHSQVTTALFKHQLLFGILNSKNKPNSSSEFHQQFLSCVESDNQKSVYFLEWREKLNKEMAQFNGKIPIQDHETASTASG